MVMNLDSQVAGEIWKIYYFTKNIEKDVCHIVGTEMSLMIVDPEREGGWKLHLTSNVVRHSRKTMIGARSG